MTLERYGMPLEIDSLTGAYQISGHEFWVNIRGWYHPEQAACRGTGRSGYAYALDCVDCSGPYLSPDSLYFTTDILIATGDTLKAGHNLAGGVDLPGLSGGGLNLHIKEDSPIRFRDSLFEIHFTGTVDTVQKTAVSAVRITNPAMLFP